MKRILAITLAVLIITLSFSGCSGYREVEEKMQGVWICNSGSHSTVYTFEDGEYHKTIYSISGDETEESGSYYVRRDGIRFSSTGDPEITYTYDETTGELQMWDENGIMLKRMNSYDL